MMVFPERRLERITTWVALMSLASIASPGTGSARDTAFVEVVLFESSPSGDYTTYTTGLQGRFSKAGATVSAEGEIVQMHPLGLCNTNDEEDLYDYGWVGVVKLEQPDLDPSCLTVLGKAKKAVQRGATAVILDVSENPDAIDQLDQDSGIPLKRPVVFVKGADAVKLMNIVNKQKVAHARIQYRQSRPGEHFDMGIFLAFFVLVSLVCLVLLVKVKLKQRRNQSAVNSMAVKALEKMETRKFKAKVKGHREGSCTTSDSQCGSSVSDCAICLERYIEGEELRVISCAHRFHRRCVDPWLLQHHTCPHCRRSILDQHKGKLVPACTDFEVSTPGHRHRVVLPLHYPGRVHRTVPAYANHSSVGPHGSSVTMLSPEHHLAKRPAFIPQLHGPLSLGAWPPCGCYHGAPCARSRGFQQSRCFIHGQTVYQHYCFQGLTYPLVEEPWDSDGSGYRGNPSLCSGYLADGPGSDSSSEGGRGRYRCALGSSNDSVLDSAENSNCGVYGSSSTFRSSLSSDYDPYMYRSRSPGADPPLLEYLSASNHARYCMEANHNVSSLEIDTTSLGPLGGTRVNLQSRDAAECELVCSCQLEIWPGLDMEVEGVANRQCSPATWNSTTRQRHNSLVFSDLLKDTLDLNGCALTPCQQTDGTLECNHGMPDGLELDHLEGV